MTISLQPAAGWDQGLSRSSVSWTKGEPTQDNFTNLFTKLGTRAAINTADLTDAFVMMNSSIQQGELHGGLLLGVAHGFLGVGRLVHSAAQDYRGGPNAQAMERVVGFGDLLTATGLIGQASGGGPPFAAVTLIGVGVSSLGTLGWALKHDS
ncbi:MAG: hypothetical protein HYU64_21675 [Armatimonadetes bacterium]|nr:hypothetical protein [Armatimonadota bacterium]